MQIKRTKVQFLNSNSSWGNGRLPLIFPYGSFSSPIGFKVTNSLRFLWGHLPISETTGPDTVKHLARPNS